MGSKIVVVGSSNIDMIVKVPRIPKPGETILGGVFATAAGGKGANQAVAAARAGGDVGFVARVGEDMFGEKSVQGFISDRINVNHVKIDKKNPSGVALIFLGEDGENSIAVASGANGVLSPEDVYSARKVIESADILVLQLEVPLESVRSAAEIATKAGVKVILNPAPACPLGDDILKLVTIITPNESEAELLTAIKVVDEKSAERAAKVLIEKGVETVLITLGPKGVWITSRNLSKLVSGFVVKAIDTTAAGDVFNGALAVAVAEKKSLLEAARFANAAAALSVTKLGAQPSAPVRKEIEEFLAKH
ncbi:MAG: ribokinase [Caldithrix sp. RBG_13_44_9]|nr:MAG: ribokinase [Caldithrix sp. RBG_13_44_9]